MADPRQRIASLVLGVAFAIFIWWGWKQGAYFGTVFYPGAIVLFAILALLLVLAPLRLRPRGPALVAICCLSALAALILVSTLWSPTQAAAVRYGWHGAVYVTVFLLGIWATNLLGPRMLGALLPVGLGVGVVAVATTLTISFGSDFSWYLHDDATLRFPIEYRNANAAFFLIGLWPLLTIATRGGRWQLRAPLIAVGTMIVGLVFLSQSRGSLPAAALAGVVYMAASRDRLKATAILALVVVPFLPFLPTLLDVYQHGHANPSVVPLLHNAGRGLILSALLSLLVAAVALGSFAPRIRLDPATERRAFAILASVTVAAILVAGFAFVSSHGGPVGFVDQRVKEFRKVGYPDLRNQGIRYGANIGSNRHDFWRVSADEGLRHPILGRGAGSFDVGYKEHRKSDEAPEDPHSAEALMFGELGFPGLLLLLGFGVASIMAALRTRRLGPAAVALAAGGLGAGVQWMTQASYDWLWNYPGVTAPAIFLLGAAAAPAMLDPEFSLVRPARRGAAALLAVLAVLAVPLYLSARFVKDAYGRAATDPAGAVEELQSAARWNPLDADPLVIRASIEGREGESAAAVADLRDAIGREPDNFEAHLLLAQLLEVSEPAAAGEELDRARELNPTDPAVNKPLSGR